MKPEKKSVKLASIVSSADAWKPLKKTNKKFAQIILIVVLNCSTQLNCL